MERDSQEDIYDSDDEQLKEIEREYEKTKNGDIKENEREIEEKTTPPPAAPKPSRRKTTKEPKVVKEPKVAKETKKKITDEEIDSYISKKKSTDSTQKQGMNPLFLLGGLAVAWYVIQGRNMLSPS